jgi:hypothetical protein
MCTRLSIELVVCVAAARRSNRTNRPFVVHPANDLNNFIRMQALIIAAQAAAHGMI